MFDYVTDLDSNRRKNTKRNQKGKLYDKSALTDTVDNVCEFRLSKSDTTLFKNIIGYDNIKKIFSFVVSSQLPVHILLVGPPGSAKTLFLMECMNLQRSYFTLGSHSTSWYGRLFIYK